MIRRLIAACIALGFAALHAAPALAENDSSLSPSVGVAVDPTLSVAPSFGVERLCLPGSTCP